LDVVGEWWTLLIVRDALLGARRFDDFKATGIADNILAARLRRLVDVGVLERVRYQDRPERFEDVLTEKGRALGPVGGGLRDWGRRWTSGEDLSPRTVHAECGHESSVGLYCPHCARTLTPRDVELRRP